MLHVKLIGRTASGCTLKKPGEEILRRSLQGLSGENSGTPRRSVQPVIA